MRQTGTETGFMKKRLLWVTLALVVATSAASLVFLLSLALTRTPAAAAEPTIASGQERMPLSCLGFVDLENGVTALAPLQPGRVDRLLVRETQEVKAGDVLLQLESTQLEHRMEEAGAQLAAARNQLAQAARGPEQQRERIQQQEAAVAAMSQRLASARSFLARKEDLLKIDQANVQDVSAALHAVKEVEALERAEVRKLAELRLHDPELDRRAAQTNVGVMEARQKQAKDALEESKLKAPRDGTVLRILAGPGDIIGGAGKQPVIVFAAAGPRLVRAEVEQEFARRVGVLQPARVVDDSDMTQSWTGRVLRVSDWYTQRRAVLQESPQVQDVRTVEVLIALDAGQPQPRLGLRVQVTINP